MEIPNLLPWNRFSAVACVIWSFAEILHNDGYDVYINEYEFEIVRKNRENNYNHSISGNIPRWFGFFNKRIREAIKEIILIRQIKKIKKKIQVIPKPAYIISWVSIGSDIGFKLSNEWSIPLISIYDNPLSEEYKFQFGFSPFLERRVEKLESRMLKNSEKVIVYSDRMVQHLKQKYNGLINFEIIQFIDFTKLINIETQKKGKQIKLIFIGSFFKWHKIDMLIRVFDKLNKEYKNIKLILVGDGPEKQFIEKLAITLDCSSNIIFTGLMDKKELFEVMNDAHIGVIPNSLWFHAPVKLFQYAAAGLTIVANDTPTIDYIFKDCKEIVSLFSSEEEMFMKIESQLKEEQSVRESRARVVQSYILNKYNNQSYLDFFKSILEKN